MSDKLLYAVDEVPIFQNVTYASELDAINCPTGAVELVQNKQTGLIHNCAFDETLVEYDQNYHNEQVYSQRFQDHMHGVAKVIKAYSDEWGLIEVGCGKGHFLELMQSLGAEITGFDPSYEGGNPNIRREYFNGSLLPSQSFLILRHVLEHVNDPFNFLQTLRRANRNGGLIYIEVPCFDWILENNAYYDVFYEHVNYFRRSDFLQMFGKIWYCENTFNGQYLSIIADLSTLRQPSFNGEGLVVDLRVEQKNSNTKHGLVVWGAASKGTIYSLFSNRAGYQVKYAIDINPAKQGRYLPLSGVPILSPSEGISRLSKKDKVLVMNPNYLREVHSLVGDRCHCESL